MKKGKAKGKGKKGKKEAGGPSLADLVSLREELEEERKTRRHFQLERDKIQALWEICRRDLKLLKGEHGVRDHEREEAKERHQVELSVYKQKVRHALSEHHDRVSDFKADDATADLLTQRHHAYKELLLQNSTEDKQLDMRETILHNKNLLQQLELKHQVERLGLTDEYDRRIREVEVKSHHWMQLTIESEERRWKLDVNQVEDRMNNRVMLLIREHGRILQRAGEYYCGILSKVQADEKALTEEALEVQKPLEQAEVVLTAAQRKIIRLREDLGKAEHKIPELQQQLVQYNQVKAKHERSRARVRGMETELRGLSIEHELLQQVFQKVERERDELLRKQMEVMMGLQQRSQLKQLQLDRRLAVLTQNVESKEAQLCAVLSTTATTAADQTAGSGSGATRKLEDTLGSKHVTIRALQEQLICRHKEYEQLLLTCTHRLSHFQADPSSALHSVAPPGVSVT